MTQTVAAHHTKIEYREPVLWTVAFINDDFTPMAFVVQVLISLFNKAVSEANDIMMMIHTDGKATVGRYTKEVACHKVDHVAILAHMNQHPLQVYAEPLAG